MSIICHILADIIHLIKLILVGSVFFNFQLQKYKKNYVVYILLTFGMICASAGIYILNNTIADAIIYFVSIIVLFMFIYQTNKLKLVISSVWIAFVTSLIDTMSKVLVNTVVEISHLNLGMIEDVVESVSSLSVVLIIAWIYRKKRKIGIGILKIKELIVFTIIAIAETLVVGVMASVVNEQGTDRILFLLALCFVVIGMFGILGFVINQFTQNALLIEQKKEIEKYLDAQESHYEYLKNKERETKKFRHDLRSHMQIIKEMTKQGKYDLVEKYFEEINEKVEALENKVSVYNEIVDAIINQYYSIACDKQITMEVVGKFPVKCNVSTYDLCTIFSNILTNAIEATQKADKKTIKLVCGNNEDGEVFINLSNTYNKATRMENCRMMTTKLDKELHGFGLENVCDSVDKYDGVMDVYETNEEFFIEIMLKNIEREGRNENCGC